MLPFIRLNYLFLVPLTIFPNIVEVFPGQNSILSVAIIAIGIVGTNLVQKRLVTTASISLLALLILGKISSDLLKSPAPDTAVFLLDFTAIILFMEASKVVLAYDKTSRAIAQEDDELSPQLQERLGSWLKGQLVSETRLGSAAVALSLGLILVGGFSSVSINQLFFSGSLVLISLALLLFLVTYRREPEARKIQ